MMTYQQFRKRCKTLIASKLITKHQYEDTVLDFSVLAYEVKKAEFQRGFRLMELVENKYFRTSIHRLGSNLQRRTFAFASHRRIEENASRNTVDTGFSMGRRLAHSNRCLGLVISDNTALPDASTVSNAVGRGCSPYRGAL